MPLENSDASFVTGSTFSGYPTVVGGTSVSAGTSTVRALQTDVNGALYITASGSLLTPSSDAQPAAT